MPAGNKELKGIITIHVVFIIGKLYKIKAKKKGYKYTLYTKLTKINQLIFI